MPSAPPSTAAAPAGPVTRLTDIYLVRDERLVLAHRAVPDPVTPQRTVQALLTGPTPAEAADGLRSALPATLVVHHVSVKENTVIIDLAEGLAAIDSQEQALALAQLVYTVTWSGSARHVKVLVDGQPVEVPRADGTLTTADLTRADYAPLLAG